jgi:broad specificity phosphatase PhoE
MTDTTVVHLLRHGEVSNPAGVLYGRLPDFHLSEDGLLMAKAASGFLAGRDVAVLLSSPMERALETAAPLAAQFGLEAGVDERLIEPWNHFEGTTFGVGDGALIRPSHWRYLLNPFRPSWGEPYTSIAARMHAAMADATSFTYQGGTITGVSYAEPAGAGRRQVPGA